MMNPLTCFTSCMVYSGWGAVLVFYQNSVLHLKKNLNSIWPEFLFLPVNCVLYMATCHTIWIIYICIYIKKYTILHTAFNWPITQIYPKPSYSRALSGFMSLHCPHQQILKRLLCANQLWTQPQFPKTSFPFDPIYVLPNGALSEAQQTWCKPRVHSPLSL